MQPFWLSRVVSLLVSFLSAILRTAQACHLAVLMPRFIAAFPDSKDLPLTGTVDLWFIVNDGGILLLTAYLLLRNRVWCKCRLRVFVVTSEPDADGMLQHAMSRFVYDLRISADVEIVEMVGIRLYFVALINNLLKIEFHQSSLLFTTNPHFTSAVMPAID